MKYKRRMILAVFWVVLGVTLFALSVMGVIDSYWSGMGGGLMGVGIMQTIRFVRYHRDAEYRESVDVENNDERNRFLYGRAWAWAGSWFILINGVAVVVLKLMGYDDQSLWAACSVCLILLLYWLSYLFARKKY